MRKKRRLFSILLSLAFVFGLAGCTGIPDSVSEPISSAVVAESDSDETISITPESESEKWIDEDSDSVSFSIPSYTGNAYAVVNDNHPYFSEGELTTNSYETYSELDSLGRCGVAEACVGIDLMPTEERESISEVRPSGWENRSYDFVDGGYLYNRCHLIGFQLTGENANEKNLITGTRYMNTEGMLPFENMVADYVQESGNHVMYRVTPVFEGENLVASGVLMEAESVEDKGEGILYCVYCFNIQPGVTIDYSTGENWAASSEETITQSESESVQTQEQEYVLNTNSMKFHKPDCSSVKDMSEKNRSEIKTTRDKLISEGYSPCKICDP